MISSQQLIERIQKNVGVYARLRTLVIEVPIGFIPSGDRFWMSA